jgi:hypothetical protein
MKRLLAILVLPTMVTGCAVYDGLLGPREALRQPALINIPESYTKAEIDAINAEMVCKQAARSPLQLSRCTTRR